MRRTDPDQATVRLVRDRDQWRCARCAGWGPLSTQHRVARLMGGTSWDGINQPANLLTLCGSGTTLCHGWVESHPTWAAHHGWTVPRYGLLQPEPATTPVWTWRGWVLLLSSGDLELLPDHPGVPGCSCGCQPTETPAGLWDTPRLA